MLQSGGIWIVVIVIGAVASGIAAVAEWRAARRSGRREHLWGAAASLALGLILASYLVAQT